MLMPDTYLGSLANLAQIAKKKKPVTPAVPTATPAVAPPVTEESIKANLGIPVMGGIDPAYLAARGGVPSTTTAPVVPTVSPAVSPTYTIQPRPISDKVLSLLSDYTRQMNRAPISAEDIMESPEYEAMRRVNELELGRGLAALSRRFSALGTLRGTPAMQTMGSLTAEAKTQLGSLVPQLVQSAYSRQQQNLSNTMNALKTLAGLEETAYGQGLSEFSATAPYKYQTVAGQTAADQWAQEFPLKKGLMEAQTAQAKASAVKSGTVAPKETDYKQTFIQNAYKKLMNGEPLTDDERRALNLDTAEKDVVAEAVKLAQTDPYFEDASEEERAGIIQRYVNMVKRLRGQSTSLPAARADIYLGATDGMTDEEIYRVFGQ